MSNSTSVDLACRPYAIPASERLAHCALARELFRERAAERCELPNGYSLRFDQEALEAVARFMENERKCCPFIRFELIVSPDSGPLWLQMTGPDGTREVLRAELNLAESSCGCA